MQNKISYYNVFLHRKIHFFQLSNFCVNSTKICKFYKTRALLIVILFTFLQMFREVIKTTIFSISNLSLSFLYMPVSRFLFYAWRILNRTGCVIRSKVSNIKKKKNNKASNCEIFKIEKVINKISIHYYFL